MPRRKILLIDADEGLAHSVAQAATPRGFDTLVATNSGDGFDVAKAHRPDVIVVNVELAPTNGWSVCTRLKKDEDLRPVPVILTSSTSTQDVFDKHSRLRTRAEEYMRKPYGPDELMRVAGSLLGLPAEPEPEPESFVVDEAPALGSELDAAAEGELDPMLPASEGDWQTQGQEAGGDFLAGAEPDALDGGGEPLEPAADYAYEGGAEPLAQAGAAQDAGAPAEPQGWDASQWGTPEAGYAEGTAADALAAGEQPAAGEGFAEQEIDLEGFAEGVAVEGAADAEAWATGAVAEAGAEEGFYDASGGAAEPEVPGEVYDALAGEPVQAPVEEQSLGTYMAGMGDEGGELPAPEPPPELTGEIFGEEVAPGTDEPGAAAEEARADEAGPTGSFATVRPEEAVEGVAAAGESTPGGRARHVEPVPTDETTKLLAGKPAPTAGPVEPALDEFEEPALGEAEGPDLGELEGFAPGEVEGPGPGDVEEPFVEAPPPEEASAPQESPVGIVEPLMEEEAPQPDEALIDVGAPDAAVAPPETPESESAPAPEAPEPEAPVAVDTRAAAHAELLERDLAALREDARVSAEQLAALRARVDELTQELETARAETVRFAGQLDEARSKAPADADAAVAEALAARDTAQTELADQKREADGLRSDLAELRAGRDALQLEVGRHSAARANAEAQAATARSVADRLRKELAEAVAAAARSAASLAAQQQKASAADERAARAEARARGAEEAVARSREALLRVVGDLGAVEARRE